MPRVQITEIDSSIFSSNNNNSDNVVFVPGPAITGPFDAPVLCESYNDFVSTFGSTPPVSDSTTGTAWDYAANLLLAGFPVLFKRIYPSGVSKATAVLNGLDTVGATDVEVAIGTVTEIHGGTGGNLLKYGIVNSNGYVYFRVFRGTTLIENIRLFAKGITDEADVANFVTTIGAKYITQFVEIEFSNPETVGAAIKKLRFDVDGGYPSLSGGADAADAAVIALIAASYPDLTDKYLFDVKFITSGGYCDAADSSMEIVEAMVTLAETRGDCEAFPDVPFGTEKEDVHGYFSALNFNSSYNAAYAPWVYMKLLTNTIKWMPPSFVFLFSLAKSIRSGNKIYDPPAGVRRATVPEAVAVEYEIGSGILDQWQNNSSLRINPIMKIRQYGYVIYGNSTLYSAVDGDPTASSSLQELGVRLIANDIKKLINNAAVSLTFERNTIHTWNEFKSIIDPYLKEMKTYGALEDYEVVMDATTTYPEVIEENTIKGVVRITVARTAENFKIEFELNRSGVTFSNEE